MMWLVTECVRKHSVVSESGAIVLRNCDLARYLTTYKYGKRFRSYGLTKMSPGDVVSVLEKCEVMDSCFIVPMPLHEDGEVYYYLIGSIITTDEVTGVLRVGRILEVLKGRSDT